MLPSKEILAEIGRISAVSAGIEDVLHSIWWRFAGLNNDVGQTITEDIKPSRLAEDIIRIARANNVSTAQINDLIDLFSEYRALAQVRNQFVHWLWHPKSGGTYELQPPAYKRSAKHKLVTLAEVRALADDLVWLETRLMIHDMDNDDILKERKDAGEKANLFVPTPWLDSNLIPIATPSKPRGFQKEPKLS